MNNSNTNNDIIRYYINGLSRSEIAAKAKVATGTVSNRVKEYKQKSKSEMYDLEEIREYMKEIRKSGFTIKECAPACRVQNILKELQGNLNITDPADFNRFSKDIIEKIIRLYNFCKKYDISPLILLEWLKDLQDFTCHYGIPNVYRQENDKDTENSKQEKNPGLLNNIISSKNSSLEKTPRPNTQIIGDIPKISSGSPLTTVDKPDTNERWLHSRLGENLKIPSVSAISRYLENLKKECIKYHHDCKILKKRAKELKSENDRLQVSIDHLYQKEKFALGFLNWFSQLTRKLANEYGIQIEDIDIFAKVMNEFYLQGYDANEILHEYCKAQSLPVQNLLLESKLEKRERRIAEATCTLNSLEVRISVFKNSISTYGALEMMGFGYDQFVLISKIIERISKKQNILLIKAANEFYNQINLDYLVF